MASPGVVRRPQLRRCHCRLTDPVSTVAPSAGTGVLVIHPVQGVLQGSASVLWYDVEIDADNEEHVTAHGVSAAEVRQVFWNNPSMRRNRRGGTADYLAVGVTDGGSRITVPFDLAGSVVRPITAWRA